MIVVLESLGRSILNGYGFILLEQPGYNKMTTAPYSQKRQVMEEKNDVFTWLAKREDVSTRSKLSFAIMTLQTVQIILVYKKSNSSILNNVLKQRWAFGEAVLVAGCKNQALKLSFDSILLMLGNMFVRSLHLIP